MPGIDVVLGDEGQGTGDEERGVCKFTFLLLFDLRWRKFGDIITFWV